MKKLRTEIILISTKQTKPEIFKISVEQIKGNFYLTAHSCLHSWLIILN